MIAFYAFRRRLQPGAVAFAILALFEAEWTLGYIGQSLAPDLQGKLLWNNIQFLGAVIVPLAYWWFCLGYSGRRVARFFRVFLIAAALGVVLFIWTDSIHGLFRTHPHLEPGYPFDRLVFLNGPAYDVYTYLGYGLLIIGTYVLTTSYISAPRIFRLQISTVLIGILIPWITTVVTWLGIVPVRLHDITPLSFAASNLVVAWALFRYRLFDLVPIAHATLVENMEDGMVVLDNESRIVDINPAGQRILDLPIRQVLGKNLLQQRAVFQELFTGGREPHSISKELELTVNGAARIFEARASALYDHRRFASGRLILLRDITERKRTEEKLSRLAITDPLTGLYNRRHFFTLAEQEYERSVRSGRPLSIVLFDVDHFKTVNDTYGHIVGDQVLETLSNRCRSVLREYDVMARYGGEEFIIMLPEADAVQARRIGERLRTVIADAAITTKAGPAVVTISLGVACSQDQSRLSLDQLVDCADQALYAAKQHNRNCLRVWGELPA